MSRAVRALLPLALLVIAAFLAAPAAAQPQSTTEVDVFLTVEGSPPEGAEISLAFAAAGQPTIVRELCSPGDCETRGYGFLLELRTELCYTVTLDPRPGTSNVRHVRFNADAHLTNLSYTYNFDTDEVTSRGPRRGGPCLPDSSTRAASSATSGSPPAALAVIGTVALTLVLAGARRRPRTRELR